MSNKDLGKRGEDLACEYLVEKGFKILERNCVLFCGEIDIIAVEKFTLLNKIRRILIPSQWNYSTGAVHFIEVKALSQINSAFFPEQRVDWKKQNKYKRLVEAWLEENKYPQNYPCQVDVVAVSIGFEKPEIKYFENITSC